MGKFNNSKSSIRLPLFIATSLVCGILIGATIKDSKGTTGGVYEAISKFREIITYIDRDYVDEVNTEELVEEAIVKVLENLDPHSVYIPREESELAQSQLKSEFDGIGIEFMILKDTIYVVAPISGGPSERLGILAGDRIVTVDDEKVAGIGINNRGVMDRLRGKKGTKVNVKVKRKHVPNLLDFNIIRDKIPTISISSHYMVSDEIGYIKIGRFAVSTYNEFKTSLDDLISQGMNKLILDLQTNPGGYMDRAIDIADEFISGNKMIVYTDGKGTRFDSEARASKAGAFEKGALIVLINESSASASEILSGAIQDNDRGLIVGRRSFGKGLVQAPITLSDGSELRLTISRYYTPSGRSIQRPYSDKLADYRRDYIKRYEQGELFHADSIKFTDSLRYTTLSGRIVYGGGGIMPDYFVPFDTSSASSYLSQLFNSNSLREFSFEYVNKNKRKLKRMAFKKFDEDFEITNSMLNDIKKIAESNHLPYNDSEFMKSQKLIKLYVKAFIARGVWDNEAFYPILNKTNKAFLKAMTLFDEAEELKN